MLEPLTHLQLIGGFVLLFLGGEGLVRGAVSLAQRLNVSPLLIGATVVAFGTSMPELVVTLQAALRGSTGIAFGNVIGSNVANLMLIFGLAIVIAPVMVPRRAVMRDGVALIGATALLTVFVYLGTLVAWQGALMLILLGLLTCVSYWRERRLVGEADVRHRHEAEERQHLPKSIWLAGLLALAGLAGVSIGAHLMVGAATIIARGLGITETVIGITVVAVGTSLPELATTVVAAYRKHADVALGNVLGSSVFNILAILGVVTVVTPLPVPDEILHLDIWLLAGITVLVIAVALAGVRLGRPFGVLLLLGYTAFTAVQYLSL
ncbi:MAG: calcium/sodium antiporter [Rhodospirillales bacterium]|nr:calcium/sodium antiporter [Rhodospirillales bacterium]MDE0378536.1 calcium/sodium antiporter [Rhodospirillales bacterium]